MIRNIVTSKWDNDNRNGINENFDYLFGESGKFSHLREEAKLILKEAQRVNATNEDIKAQLDNLILDGGDSNAEVSQARGYRDLLNDRINDIEDVVARTNEARSKQSLVYRKTNSDKPMITWIDDDCHKGVYTKLFPIAKQYGIKLNSAVITNRGHGFPLENSAEQSSTYCSYDEILEMRESGLVEFVAHTHTHNNSYRLTQMTEEEIHEDLSLNKEMMRKLGLNHNHLVFPFGAYNDTVLKVTRQYFDSAFDTTRRFDSSTGDIVGFPMSNYTINRTILNGDFDDVEVMRLIDKLVEEKGWMVWCSHVDQFGGQNLEKTHKVIEYALSKGVEFTSVEEGVNAKGNIAELDNFTINSKGVVEADGLGNIKYAGVIDTEIPFNSHPDEYLDIGKTIEKVRAADVSLLGIGTYLGGQTSFGYLETYTLSESAYAYQSYIDVNNAKEYRRFWDRKNDTWLEWTSQNNYSLDRKPGLINENLDYFIVNSTTAFKVTLSESKSIGLPYAGIIECYRDSEDEYSYQRYMPHNGTYNVRKTIYFRNWDSSKNTWTDWVNVSGRKGMPSSYPIDTPMTDLERNVTTFKKVNAFQARDNNLGGYGYIETFRDATEDTYSYQKYINVVNAEIKIRNWNASDGAWGEWQVLNKGLIYDTKEMDISQSTELDITNFEKGVTTKKRVNIPQARDNGLTGYGYLETYRDNSNDTYSYQKYTDVSSGTTKIRNWDMSNGVWSDWK